MANTSYRKPIIAGDDNTWAQYNDAFIKQAIGEFTCQLYNDAGVLKITKGRIGIDDGTVLASNDIDTVTTISLAAVTNSNWAKIEMTVSGVNVTFTASDFTVAQIDPAIIPTTFESAYNAAKGGYYIAATKRCIGIVWVNAAGTLEGVINSENGIEGYNGYSITDDADNDTYEYNYKKGRRNNHGTFNRDDPTQDDVFNALKQAVPTVGDKVMISYTLSADNPIGNDYKGDYSIVERNAANQVTCYGIILYPVPNTIATDNQVSTEGDATIIGGAAFSSWVRLSW